MTNKDDFSILSTETFVFFCNQRRLFACVDKRYSLIVLLANAVLLKVIIVVLKLVAVLFRSIVAATLNLKQCWCADAMTMMACEIICIVE